MNDPLAKRRKRQDATESEKNGSAVFLNDYTVFLISQMLPGEYSIATLPLVRKAMATARLCLNLYSSSSSFQWTKEALMFSVPRRHWIRSIQLSRESILLTGDLSWLATMAPKLEHLTLSVDRYAIEMESDTRVNLRNFPESLRSLELGDFSLQDADLFRSLVNLTKVTLQAVHCQEHMALTALWESPLVSLCICDVQLWENEGEGEEYQPPSRTDPPRFALTLREVDCNEDSTVDALTPYCQHLEKLTCFNPRGLADVNLNLLELNVSSCPSEVAVTLRHPSLETLYLDFDSEYGVVQGTCPNVKHLFMYNVELDSALKLLSTCTALQSVRLVGVNMECQEQYIEYFLSPRFPKLACKVHWESLSADQLTRLLENGVQLGEACVVKVADFINDTNSLPLTSLLKQSTYLDLSRWSRINPSLMASMTSLRTVRSRVRSVDAVQLLFNQLPSLTDLNVVVHAEINGGLHLHSPNLRCLVITLDNSPTEGTCILQFPKLTKLDICLGKHGLFTGNLLSELVSNGRSDSIDLPHLHSLTFLTNGTYNDPRPTHLAGHPQLRELLLRGMNWKSFHLQNVPNLRFVQLTRVPAQELWLDLPARCIVQLGTSSIKPFLPPSIHQSSNLNHLDGSIDLPPSSSLMLRLWGLHQDETTWSLCPLCRDSHEEKKIRHVDEEKKIQRCKHGAVSLGLRHVFYNQVDVEVDVLHR